MAIRELERDWETQSDLDCDDCAAEISPEELWSEIDAKSRRHLGMSGAEFVRQYRSGSLEDTFVVAELGFLLRCLDDAFIPA